ncbi:MAG TPA: Fe-S protein assembly co-chaperone HscB [Chitinophagaceae bacterium]|nr:Fe-S protein assembly co-chaperone HscB [Chitinophagaceae bacterium]
MNFFELYNMPVTLNPDKAYVTQKYYELSRQYHPDFFSGASPERQAEVLRVSSDVNRAYKTFTDRDATIRYVLQTKELLEDEEKYVLDPEFLMEVLDINESLMDLDEQDAMAVENIKTKVDELEREIYKPVQGIIEGYGEGVTSTEELLQVKDYYYKKKYLHRILDKIGGMRNIAARD